MRVGNSLFPEMDWLGSQPMVCKGRIYQPQQNHPLNQVLAFLVVLFLSSPAHQTRPAPQWSISPRLLYQKCRRIYHLFINSETYSEKPGINYYWLNALSCSEDPKFCHQTSPTILTWFLTYFLKKLINFERITYPISTPKHMGPFLKSRVFCPSTFWDSFLSSFPCLLSHFLKGSDYLRIYKLYFCFSLAN